MDFDFLISWYGFHVIIFCTVGGHYYICGYYIYCWLSVHLDSHTQNGFQGDLT